MTNALRASRLPKEVADWWFASALTEASGGVPVGTEGAASAQVKDWGLDCYWQPPMSYSRDAGASASFGVRLSS